ncbi:hypothetical protein [Lichenifustis flavocetrariae]|uniref:Uncharacterized protein n=1 Tax=Lichenifustis flavocetrariae TaxID=2949735 RepID=A0AA41YZ88_9HYPH|nr:hypothetical protein [Lichenifustis flavocetrariae]MCW6510854.1 hypothetical protein [Lichenifustis flavocetrariae]
MLNIRTFTAIALLCASTSAFAQATAPAAPAPAPAPAAAAPATPPAASDMTKDGKPRMKVVRAQCREEVKGENLKGDARREAMGACIVKQRPDKEAQVKCSMDPSLKGMAKSARHDVIKACVAKAKG